MNNLNNKSKQEQIILNQRKINIGIKKAKKIGKTNFESKYEFASFCSINYSALDHSNRLELVKDNGIHIKHNANQYEKKEIKEKKILKKIKQALEENKKTFLEKKSLLNIVMLVLLS